MTAVAIPQVAQFARHLRAGLACVFLYVDQPDRLIEAVRGAR